MSAIILLTIGLTLLTACIAYEQDLNSMYDYTPSASDDDDLAYDLEADDDQQDGGASNHYPTVLRSKRMFGAALSRVPPYQWGLLERDHAPEDRDDEDDDEDSEGRPKRTTKRMSIFRERERHMEDVKKRNKKRFWEHENTEAAPIYYAPAPPSLELSSGGRNVGLRELLSVGNGLDLDRDLGRFGGRFKAKKTSRPDHWYPALELSKRSFDYQDDDDVDGNADDDGDDEDDSSEGSEVESVFPVAKRSVKRTDKNVMITLEKILADDEENTNASSASTNKTATAKVLEAAPKTLHRAKKSWDDYVGIDKRSAGGPKKPVQDWAVDYYLKSMARAMSSKRKRGANKSPPMKPTVPTSKSAAKKPQPNLKNEPIESDDQMISSASNHHTTDDRLKGIEKVVLEQAGELIRGEHGHGHPSSDSRRILNRLDVAYNLENLRQALENFEASLSKMKDEDQDYVKKSIFTKAIARAPDSGSNASHQPDSTNDNSNNNMRNNDGRDDTDDCDVMKSILRHCVGLSRTVGDPAGALVGPCTSHVICHSCADAETSATECAQSFLWSASKVCGDNFRCQTAAGAIRSVIMSDLAHLAKKEKHLCPRRHCIEKFARLEEVGR